MVERTVAATYRFRLGRDGLEVLSEERVIRHVDPGDYTGLAGDVYALIRPIRPDTIVDVVHGSLNNPLNPHAVAQAHHGYDRIEVSDAFAEGGAARGDLKAVVLHELGHLLQWDAYGGDARPDERPPDGGLRAEAAAGAVGQLPVRVLGRARARQPLPVLRG